MTRIIGLAVLNGCVCIGLVLGGCVDPQRYKFQGHICKSMGPSNCGYDLKCEDGARFRCAVNLEMIN